MVLILNVMLVLLASEAVAYRSISLLVLNIASTPTRATHIVGVAELYGPTPFKVVVKKLGLIILELGIIHAAWKSTSPKRGSMTI